MGNEKRIKPEGRQSETSLEWETDAERWGAGERLSQKLTGKKKGCWTGPWKDHACGANEAITNWQKDRGIHASGFPCLFLISKFENYSHVSSRIVKRVAAEKRKNADGRRRKAAEPWPAGRHPRP